MGANKTRAAPVTFDVEQRARNRNTLEPRPFNESQQSISLIDIDDSKPKHLPSTIYSFAFTSCGEVFQLVIESLLEVEGWTAEGDPRMEPKLFRHSGACCSIGGVGLLITAVNTYRHYNIS